MGRKDCQHAKPADREQPTKFELIVNLKNRQGASIERPALLLGSAKAVNEKSRTLAIGRRAGKGKKAQKSRKERSR